MCPRFGQHTASESFDEKPSPSRQSLRSRGCDAVASAHGLGHVAFRAAQSSRLAAAVPRPRLLATTGLAGSAVVRAARQPLRATDGRVSGAAARQH